MKNTQGRMIVANLGRRYLACRRRMNKYKKRPDASEAMMFMILCERDEAWNAYESSKSILYGKDI
jgi:hypothetical protein